LCQIINEALQDKHSFSNKETNGTAKGVKHTMGYDDDLHKLVCVCVCVYVCVCVCVCEYTYTYIHI